MNDKIQMTEEQFSCMFGDCVKDHRIYLESLNNAKSKGYIIKLEIEQAIWE